MLLVLFQRILLSFCSALIVGMRRNFVQGAPLGRPFFPGLVELGVVVGVLLLVVSKLPADVSLHTLEVILICMATPRPAIDGLVDKRDRRSTYI